MTKKLATTLIFILLISAPAFVLAANVYENNPASCPTNYQAQTCLGNTVLCGYSGGIVYCYDKTTLSGNVPSGDTTTSSAPATISINGGYIVDCASYDSAAPYCDNSGNFICNADNTYYNTDHVQTTCNGTHWASDGASAYTYGSCLSGYQDCNSSPNTCEVHNGVTSYPGGYAHATYAGVQSACTPACMPGYYDCNSGGSGPASGDGCETQNNTSSGACASPATWVCTQTGSSCWGQDGTQTYSCTCTYAKNNFQAATLNEYSSSSGTPLLWGKEDGTDNLIQFANSSTPSLFTVDSYGNLATAGTGTSSFTGKLSVNSTITNVISSTSGVAQIGNVIVGTQPDSVAVSGRYAYVTNNGSNTISVVDISNPSSPYVVGTATVGTNPWSVAVSGRYAYVTNNGSNTISVVDISNPSSPVQIGTPLTVGTSPFSIAISGRYAYVTNGGSNNISVVDISNPSSPVQVATLTVGTTPFGIAVSGRYAYVANFNSNNVYIVDISNPASPSLVSGGTVAVGTQPFFIAVSGRYAYTANSGSGNISIIDIKNPASPSIAGTASVGAGPLSVAVSGRYAYTANSGGGISIVDVSNPSSPTQVATATVGNTPYFVAVSGRYAYAVNYGDSPGTLSVVDLAGSEMGSLYASSLETGELQATKNIVAQGNITGDSLLAGQNGVFSTGPITSSGAGTFGSLSLVGGSYHTNFQGQSQSANLTYTLPSAYPSTSGYVLSSTTGGTMSWVPGGGAGGTTGQIQYNNGGALGGFGSWNGYTMSVGGSLAVAGGTVAGSTGYLAVGSGTNAIATGAIAMGYNLTVSGLETYQTAIGKYNSLSFGDSGNYAFIIGNGTSGTPSNALTVDWAGNAAVTGGITSVTSSNSFVKPVSYISVGSGTLPRAIAMSGRYAYIANYTTGTVSVADVTKPSGPAIISTSSAVGTNPQSIAVSGRYAYTANAGSANISIIDISNPYSPSLVSGGTVTVGTTPVSIAVSGHYAYVANYGSNNISVVNISNPSAPAQVATLTVGTQPDSIAVLGRYAYVANYGSNNVYIVDISNPASPSLVSGGTVTVGTTPDSIAVSGRYAYVANYGSNSVSVVDISNPASPSVTGTATLTSGANPISLVVSGRYLYVADYSLSTNNFSIIDVSNPSSPAVVGSPLVVTLGTNPNSIAVSGRYAYVTNGGSNNLYVVDLSGSEFNSLYASSLETGELQATKNIVAQGNIAGDSLLAGQNGIFSAGPLAVSATSTPSYFGDSVGIGTTTPRTILDVNGTITNLISSNSGVQQIGTPLTIGTHPHTVAVSGRYAYVSNYGSNTLDIIDISNPSSPSIIGTVTVGTNPASVTVSGRYAYVVNYGSNNISVVDISNKVSPTVVGTATVGTNPYMIAISGRYAYVTNVGDNTMSVVDITNPSSPVQVATAATGAAPWGVAVSGRYAYVTNSNYTGLGPDPNTVYVLDISNPLSPTFAGKVTVGTYPHSVAVSSPVSGRYAYVANDGSNTIFVLDISNPASPSVVTSLSVAAGPQSIVVDGRYAYVANYGASLISVLDISNPASPSIVATAPVGTNPEYFAVSGRYAYVPNWTDGTMSVVDLSGSEFGSLNVGSLETGELQTTKNIIAQGNVMGDSLFAGQNGILSTGPLSVSTTTVPSYFAGDVDIAGGTVSNGGYLAVGGGAVANALGSIAMGYSTNATGTYSIAMGNATNAVGADSIAMGYSTNATGTYSIAMGNATNAVGADSIAMGYLSAASGNYSAAIGYNAAASGINSTAMGIDTTASGINSTAMGNSTNATGTDSTAMGNSTNATGDYSTAMGHGAGATGDNSTAMGFATTAQGYDQTVIGTNNILQGTKSSKASTDYALIIGNGVPGTPSDALTVDWSGNVNIPSGASYEINGTPISPSPWIISGSNIYYNLGNVGIGTSSPAGGKLNVAAASGSQNAAFFNTNDWDGVSNGSGLQIAFGASSGNTYSELNPLTAGGGNVGNLVLNANYVGVGQTSPGYKLDVNGTANATEYCISGSNCITSWPGIGGVGSFATLEVASGTLGGTGIMAVGYGSVASEAGGGSGSIAMGYNVTSNGNYTFATGAGTTASSQFSTAMGSSTTASGYSSFAEGENSQATNIFDVAMGNHNTASGGSSVALGGGTAASGIFSTATGEYTTASGDNSTAMGFGTTAQGYVQTVIGESNAATGTASTKVSTDYAFIIGNGVYGSYNSDALAVNWNGDLYLGGTSHSNAFDVAEDYSTKDSTLSPGEIVALDTSNPLFVVRADSSNSPVILGIVSTDPGVELGETKAFLTEAKASAGGPTVPVALSGRVPTKVNLEGGAISVGDRITLSSTPGVGMKAPAGSDSIGFALEPFDGGGNTPAAGTINVFVQNQQYDAILGLSVDGTVGSGTINFSKNINVNTITAASARVNDLEMVTANGDVYCTWIDDSGNLQKVKGDCATVGPGVSSGTASGGTTTSGTTTSTAVTGVSLNETSKTLTAGDTDQLAATISPSDASNQNVTWSSSDSTIASVTSTGLVTAVAQGSATVTATTADGSFTVTDAITVNASTQGTQQIQAIDVSSLSTISDINVDYGTALTSLTLPTTVNATMSDSSMQSLSATWDQGTPAYDPNTPGTYAFSGTLTLPLNTTNTQNLKASVNVIVAQQPTDQAQPSSDDTGTMIQNTASGLLNGVRDFVNWIFGAGLLEPIKNMFGLLIK